MAESDSEVPERHISDSEAREEDIAQRARDTGRSIEQVRQIVSFEDAFDAYRSVLRKQYKNRITGSWVNHESVPKGYVRFVQEIPAGAVAALAPFEILDSDNVILLNDGTMSAEDHSRRSPVVAEALVDLGYRYIEVAFDVAEDKLEIILILPEEATPLNVRELVAALQQQLNKDQSTNKDTTLQGRAAIIEVDDIELVILRGDSPMVEFDNDQGER